MTTLRRLIFPLFATCVALAVGIALGSGPLRGSTATGDTGSGSANAELSDELAAMKEGDQFSEAAAAKSAPQWIDDVLNGDKVTLVVLPGVHDDRVTATQDTIAQASGKIAATVRIDPDYVDPAKKTYVDTVAEQSLQSADDLAALTKAETYQQAGALVARAYVGTSESAAFDDEAVQIDSELAGAKLLKVDAAPISRGNVVIVLAPGSEGDSAKFDARNTIVGALVIALTKQADGAVLVTPPSGGEPGGLIGSINADPDAKKIDLSTVNVSTGIAAQGAAVRALQQATWGKPSTFGIVDGKPVFPPGM